MNWAHLLPEREAGQTIQGALRQSIISAIGAGRLAAGQRMPPSRALAERMGVARNTIIAVYEELVARGYLISTERRGYFVEDQAGKLAVNENAERTETRSQTDWNDRFATMPAAWRHISKPTNWQDYRFPFIYGQVDPELFPVAVWRTCSRDAMGRSAVNYWAADQAMDDDPLLIEQICRQILPQHGVFARPEEVLVTLGSQHGLYLLSQLLVKPGELVGIEEPGYTDARNIFALSRGQVRGVPVDAGGMRLGPWLQGLRYAVVTPAHQCPTMVTMPNDRRQALLKWAGAADAVLIEDDYEGETRFEANMPALKSMDRDGRVIYLGTLSKVLAPGVRIGFMVAPEAVIREARALRRLMHRSAPLNNQRTAAIFLAEGHCQGLVRSLRHALKERWETICAAVAVALPDFPRSPSIGGSSIWLTCPADINPQHLLLKARERGVLFEPGEPFFATPPGEQHFRLGFSSIPASRINEGVQALAAAVADLRLQTQRSASI
ncbi:PLP-dependent aminotransferase family protein [Ferrovibrio sp.]|uniref:MocR-like pyridoxine biosynthesis transcription factor PdxR n=1 Tax=Ferrovibrio sp. TaxID=1917215 RepID=UPI001B665147|nr:PLP-dependent aminotransferase family protein [Ferrovibrio sp.]MBP7064138.1 PLP-dependent aminotransferase family protein [Ferrovibrio sp.]